MALDSTMLHPANGGDIPLIGFGTWPLKGEECSDMVHRALRAGYRHIDTAKMYDNEAAVGAGIRAADLSRGEVFLTTKIWPEDMVEGRFQKQVEDSLEKLSMERVDLLLMHWPRKDGDVAEWMRLLNLAAERGWATSIGVANFTVDQMDKAVAASQRPIACNQVEQHPFIDQRKVRAACDRHGMALVAYCPLARAGTAFSNETIKGVAQAHDRSPAQIVLRWHVQRGGVAIPKTATPARLAENIAIFDFELSADEMAAIDALRSEGVRICDFEFSPQWDEPGPAQAA